MNVSLQTCHLNSLAHGLNIFFRMNGFTGHLLLAPDNLIIIQPAEVRNNHEILTIRECDTVPMVSFFDEATRHCLMSGIFISETDLVHEAK